MLIETTELTLSHVGLGRLTESSLMALCGSAMSHHLMQDTGRTIRDIVDCEGKQLYPAYFSTHLIVPPANLLQQFEVWDSVAVGVDVRRFGGMMATSSYVVGRPGEVTAESMAAGRAGHLPSMTAGTLFIVDENRSDARPGTPKAGILAEMPSITKPPECVALYAKAQSVGGDLRSFSANLRPRGPHEHLLRVDQDTAVNHAVMFATFARLFEQAERVFLEQLVPMPMPTVVVDSRHVLERQSYYLRNCYAGETLRFEMLGRFLPAPKEMGLGSAALLPSAVLELVIEVFQHSRNALVCVTSVKEVIAIARSNSSALRDVERVLYHYRDANVAATETPR